MKNGGEGPPTAPLTAGIPPWEREILDRCLGRQHIILMHSAPGRSPVPAHGAAGGHPGRRPSSSPANCAFWFVVASRFRCAERRRPSNSCAASSWPRRPDLCPRRLRTAILVARSRSAPPGSILCYRRRLSIPASGQCTSPRCYTSSPRVHYGPLAAAAAKKEASRPAVGGCVLGPPCPRTRRLCGEGLLARCRPVARRRAAGGAPVSAATLGVQR